MTHHLQFRRGSGQFPGFWLWSGLVAAVWLVSPATSQGGYLTFVGPSPLRFETTPKLPVAAAAPVSLPPVPVPVASNETEAGAEPLAPTAIPFPFLPLEPEVTKVKSPAAVEPSEGMIAPAPPFVPGDPNLVAPQMVLPFFRGQPGDTNALATALSTQVMFIPPTRVQRTPSKATYSTP